MSSIAKITITKGNVKNKTSLAKSDHSKLMGPSKCDKHQLKSDISRPVPNIDYLMNNQEDMAWHDRIKQVMELTSRSEDEVIMALHDSDGDLNRAVNDLLEGVSPEWEVKKKKARQSTGSKSTTEQIGETENSIHKWSHKSLVYTDGPMHIRGRANHNDRGWRRRENKENEKIMENHKFENEFNNSRRGRITCARSGRGGRGGGRGLGPRTFANRGDQMKTSKNHNFSRPIETWTGNEEKLGHTKNPSIDSWNPVDVAEDWDNEEYTGSLADTKVFTPSSLNTKVITASDNFKNGETCPSKSSKLSQSIVQKSLCKISADETKQDQSHQQVLSLIHATHPVTHRNNRNLLEVQSEYFAHLADNNNDCLNVSSGQPTFITVMTNQPQKSGKQRPRVPPPSKIPSSAVEMPGDALNTSISYLDVQFGALEFGSDANTADSTSLDKYITSESTLNLIQVENTIQTKNSASSLTSSTAQISSQKLNSATEILHNDNQCSSKENLKTSSGFTNLNANSQAVDIIAQELHTSLNSSLNSTSSYNSPTNFQPSAKYSSSGTGSNYSTYSCNSQQNQLNITSSAASSTYSVITSTAPTAYASPYTKPSTFSQTLPSSCGPSGIYNQTSTTSQNFQATSGFTTPNSQFQSQSSPTTVCTTNSAYITGGYPNASSYQSTPQTYQPPHTAYTSVVSQASSVYSNAVQSVYSNSYTNYVSQNQQGTQDSKVLTNKELVFETTSTTSSTSLVTSTTCNLSLSSTSVSTSQTKTTISNAITKNSVSGLTPSSSSNSSSISGSGASGSVAPILSHQYIMGQSVPYATFQQPHMYSYEDLQLIQQRMPHMPTTGYYDATLGYQTTGPVTSLGSSRTDTLSGVQSVPGVQTVQAQYTSMNDARFARTDSNASPVSSTISQQNTQHQQPLMNPIPPGYAYFYGGGIMPASGFQYGTPAIYPQIATAGNTGNSNGAYSTKTGNYNSAYGNSTNYDTLTSSGSSDYKNSTSGYSNSQNKNSSTNNSTNPVSTSDMSGTIYSKGHATLNKVNSYEKQTFHSATPPPFGLTNSQSANVIGGYGAAHLFIPTVPHQLHQTMHQDNTSSVGQRSSSGSQGKAQLKSGYNTSYWTGGN